MIRYFVASKKQIMLTEKWEQVLEKAAKIPKKFEEID